MIDPFTEDEWLDALSQGQCFAGRILTPAVGGLTPNAQIFNPIGSGIRVRLRVYEPMTIFAFGINTNMRRHDVALPTLGPFGIIENLLGGAPAPVAELRQTNVAPAIGSPFWLILAAGNTRHDYAPEPMDWAQDLLPGQGLMGSSGPGAFILAGFQWAEVPL